MMLKDKNKKSSDVKVNTLKDQILMKLQENSKQNSNSPKSHSIYYENLKLPS